MTQYAAQEASDNRCNLCNRPFVGPRFYYQDDPEAPEPRRGWTICATCSAAVGAELARMDSGAALRLRVALGVVAGERGPSAEVREAEAAAEDLTVTRAVLWTVWAAFLVHALVFVAVVVEVALHH